MKTSCMLSLSGRRAWTVFVALALTIVVCEIKAQSNDSVTDEAKDGAGVSVPDSWSAGPNLLSAAVRAVGVYFPANGRFYIMGGRALDTAGSDFTASVRVQAAPQHLDYQGGHLP